MNKFLFSILFFSIFSIIPQDALEKALYLWGGKKIKNFGDELSQVIIEQIIHKEVKRGALTDPHQLLFAVGSVLHFARDGNIIWGSGYRENPLQEVRNYKNLDVRAVRGPRTRDFLLQLGIECPEIYGDPALLLPILMPQLKREEPVYDYIVIPHFNESCCFKIYKNVVYPTEPWNEVVKKILQSKFVISSSLHGIIIAEAFGVPARLLRMTRIEPFLKYQDYYEATGRANFQYASSVREALQMGGESPLDIDLNPLINSFPYDYFD